MHIALLFAVTTIMICSLQGLRVGLGTLRFTECAKVQIFGREMFVKRDDQNVHSSGLNGNKGRKLMSLLSLDISSPVIASYGGVQSNSMLALSRIARFKQKKLRYITTQIPPDLKSKPTGNYKLALDGGTEFVEASQQQYRDIAQWSEAGAEQSTLTTVMAPMLPAFNLDELVWVRQGGAMPAAKEGVFQLGAEIAAFVDASTLPGPWKVIVASGTGTTSYFLANYFAAHRLSRDEKQIEVVSAPCVGSSDYLKEQMSVLDAQSGSTGVYPSVLSTSSAPKRPFAKPNKVHLSIWEELRSQTGIEFDLIYAPRTFELLTHQGGSVGKNAPSLEYFLPEANLIYYHCGGVEGNESQLSRYLTLGLR